MRTPDTRRLGALLFDFDHTLADLGRWVDWQAARVGIQALYTEVGLDVMEILRVRRGRSPMALLDAALQAHAAPIVPFVEGTARILIRDADDFIILYLPVSENAPTVEDVNMNDEDSPVSGMATLSQDKSAPVSG